MLGVTFVLAGFLVERQVRRSTLDDALSDLAFTLDVVEQLALERREQRHGQVRLAATDAAVVRELADGDRRRLEAALERLLPMLEDAGLLAVLDPAGRLEVATGPALDDHVGELPPPTVEPLAHALHLEGGGAGGLDAADPSAATDGVWILGEELFEIAAAPVAAPGGETLGALVLGERLTDAIARRLREISPSEVVILADRRLVGTSLPADQARRVIEAFPELGRRAPRHGEGRSHGEPRRVEVGGVPHLARLASVPVDYGGLYCNHILLRSLEPSLALARKIRWQLVAVALGALALAFAAAWVGSRRIAGPLRRLAEGMSRVSRSGELEPPPETAGGGRELQLFQSAFRRMLETLEDSRQARERSYLEAIGAVMAAVDRRDRESAGHSYRVACYAVALARRMGVEGEELQAVEWGALLHDVGKIAVPDQILHKGGPLSDKEWQIMRQHPGWGYEMLAGVRFLEPALAVVHNHHERWDGGGYPRGISAEEIPLPARIFSVVDTYDAITSDRHYRPGRSHREAVEELRRVAGSQLDPRVVAAFLEIPREELDRLRLLSDESVTGIQMPEEIASLLAEVRTGTGG